MSTNPKRPTIVLGRRPEAIKATVMAALPDGTEGAIEMTYRYRTRTEFGELIDQRMEEARKADQVLQADGGGDDAPPPPFSVAELQSRTLQATTQHILDIATGWGLPEPFDAAHVQQLCNELPGMASAIVERYRAVILEGRLGNS